MGEVVVEDFEAVLEGGGKRNEGNYSSCTKRWIMPNIWRTSDPSDTLEIYPECLFPLFSYTPSKIDLWAVVEGKERLSVALVNISYLRPPIAKVDR